MSSLKARSLATHIPAIVHHRIPYYHARKQRYCNVKVAAGFSLR